MKQWAEKKGEEGLEEYWQDRNQESIDGKPTEIFAKQHVLPERHLMFVVSLKSFNSIWEISD